MDNVRETFRMDEISSFSVLNNPMLLEMILKYVLWGSLRNDSNLTTNDLKSCRSVCRQWIVSIQRIFKVKHIPLLHLNIGLPSSRLIPLKSEAGEEKNQRNAVISPLQVLDLLSKSVVCSSLNVGISAEVFTNFDNCCLIAKIFSRFGGSICHLSLNLPTKISNPFYIFDSPMTTLRKIYIGICSSVMNTLNEVRTAETSEHQPSESSMRSQLLKVDLSDEETIPEFSLKVKAPQDLASAVIHSAVNLRELAIIGQNTNYALHLEDFEALNSLPKTLQILKLRIPIRNLEDFRFLQKNRFPHLGELRLVFIAQPTEDLADVLMSALHDVLSILIKTLKTLSLEYIRKAKMDPKAFSVKLPILPNLTHLQFSSGYSTRSWNLQNFNITDHLPALQYIKLIRGDESLFRKITEKPSYTVKQFSFIGPHLLTIDDELGLQACKSFENLTKLEFCTWGPERSGLRVIFKELSRLQVLKMLVGGSPGSSSMDLDSAFVGISARMCNLLRIDDQELWKGQLIDTGMFPSIRRLTELTSLSITSTCFPTKHPSARITALSFHCAFFKMQKLVQLKIGGDIKNQISDALLEQWANVKNTHILMDDNLSNLKKLIP